MVATNAPRKVQADSGEKTDAPNDPVGSQVSPPERKNRRTKPDLRRVDKRVDAVFSRGAFRSHFDPLSADEMNAIGELVAQLSRRDSTQTPTDTPSASRLNALERVYVNLSADKIMAYAPDISGEEFDISDIDVGSDSKYYVGEKYIEVNGIIYLVINNGPFGLDIIGLTDISEIRTLTDRKGKDSRAKRPELPRWAEENRPKKQVNLRLPPDVLAEVEASAAKMGVDRNAWITMAVHKALKPS